MSCCGTKSTMLLACSGGSNVGQIANDAARTLDSLGQGTMFCSIGVALRLKDFEASAKAANARVAIDGCRNGCVRKALEALSIPVDAHVVVTDLGIEKAHRFDYTHDDVAAVGDAVLQAVKSL